MFQTVWTVIYKIVTIENVLKYYVLLSRKATPSNAKHCFIVVTGNKMVESLLHANSTRTWTVFHIRFDTTTYYYIDNNRLFWFIYIYIYISITDLSEQSIDFNTSIYQYCIDYFIGIGYRLFFPETRIIRNSTS